MTLMQQEIDLYFSKITTVFLNTYEGIIPKAVLERYPSKKRASHHYTSRLALLEALQNCGLNQFENYSDLGIVNHHHMEEAKNALVSLSHTNEFAMAAATYCEEIKSIGVDLENCSREIKPGIEKFFINEEDEIKSTLHLWCIKEAAFKAISPLYKDDKQLVLKDIAVKSNGDFKLLLEPAIDGHWKLASKEQMLFTHALILKNSQ